LLAGRTLLRCRQSAPSSECGLLGSRRQELFEKSFACLQCYLSQIYPVQIEQIERVIDELRDAVLAENVLHRLEVSRAVCIERDDLAIEDGLLDGQLGGGCGEVRQVLGP